MIGRLLGLLLSLAAPAAAQPSQCYGSSAQGRLTGAQELPLSGPNFRAYSRLGHWAGRTYLHSAVRQLVLDAYRELESTQPGRVFVYGETGARTGGPLPPHRSHQNGLSVDFFVPVIDAAGHPAFLAHHPANRFGYDIEFDAQGRYRDWRIDIEALAQHLLALVQASQQRQLPIRRIILAPELVQRVRATAAGRQLPERLFMTRRPWVRHDEHYHLDFELRCLPLAAFKRPPD